MENSNQNVANNLGIMVSKDIVIVDYIPSVNNVYKISRGRMYLDPDAKKYKQSIINQLGQYTSETNLINFYLAKKYSLRLEILFLLNQSKGIRDTDNMIKLSQDCLQSFYKFNDKAIADLIVRRRFHTLDTKKEIVVMKLYADVIKPTIEFMEEERIIYAGTV